MKDTAKPMKSIRQEILIALNKHGEQTVDDMLDQVAGGFSRKQIGDNIAQVVVDKLATRRKDDVTGLPAYKITELGKSRIKSDAEPVKESLTAQPDNSVVKQNLTTQSASAPVTVSSEKIAEIEAAIDAGQAENGRLRAELKLVKQQRDSFEIIAISTAKALESAGFTEEDGCNPGEMIAALDAGKNRLERMFGEAMRGFAAISEALKLDPNAGGAQPILAEIKQIQDESEVRRHNYEMRSNDHSIAVDRIDELCAAVDIKESELQTVIAECNRLKSESMALKTLNESMPGFGAAYEEVKNSEQQITVEQFLIRVPKRKPLLVKSFEKARQHAMSAAKTVGKVEVFAMVEVGHAVRGAVWNQKQA